MNCPHQPDNKNLVYCPECRAAEEAAAAGNPTPPPLPTGKVHRETFIYSKNHEGQYLDSLPHIHGMRCTGWSARDLMNDHEEAMTALAKIALGDFDYSDMKEIAEQVFESQKEQAYTYYDPDEGDDEDNGEDHAGEDHDS